MLLIYKICRLSIISVVLLLWGTISVQASFQQLQTQEIKNPEWGIWQDADAPPVQFEIVQTFGAEDKSIHEILPMLHLFIRGLFSDDSGNIYFLNVKSEKVISFGPDGQLRWAVGRKGRGPGDFLTPRDIAWDQKEYLYVLDKGNTRIDQYDMNGNYLSSYILPDVGPFFPENLFYIAPNKFFISSPVTKEYAARTIIAEINNDNLNTYSALHIQDHPHIQLPLGHYRMPDHNVIDQQVYVGSKNGYYFYSYDLLGRSQKKISRNYNADITLGIFNKKNRSSIVDIYGGTSAPIPFSDDYYLQQTYWPKNVEDPQQHLKKIFNNSATPVEYERSLDLLNSNFELLYSIHSTGSYHKDAGKILTADKQGHIYSYFPEPYPYLKKIKVTIIPPKP
ncbi:MAG: 6-bladed beta-propeller [Balneolaceae bacterium]|nr:6-bladed beta-propeller [Balneolaceae bacterium]